MGKIMYLGDEYSSDGTTVIPNPEGEATDDLNTVQIGEDIFNVVGSGGSGGSVVALPSLYSTQEKMVGLWTDGKPLYQKTMTIPIVNVQDFTLADESVSYDKLVYSNGIVYANIANPTWISHSSNRQTSPRIAVLADHKLYYYAENLDTAYSFRYQFTVQYTKTADTPVEDFNLQDFGIFTPVIYSLEEREIGVWTDGKPLYEKTINCGAMIVDTNSHDVAHNISNIDKVVFVCGIGFNSSNQFFPLPNYRPNAQSGILLRADRANVAYMNNWTEISATYATLRYTKTTDVAGSGSYAELGVPAVHYDNTERVIGTWFGETLYRRTITGLSIALDGTQWVGYSGANYIDKLINLHAYSNVNGALLSNCIAEYYYYPTNSTLYLCSTSSTFNRTISILTIEYTKTTT